jgi:hypothetical protein
MPRKKQAETENTVPNTDSVKPWQFQPGQSGNPAGKPPGVKHRATQAVLALLEGETEALTRKAVELALEGDTMALKLCLDRLAAPLKPSALPVRLDMPPPDNLTDTARAFVAAAARGEIPPDIAAQLVAAVASVARVEELEQVKHRLEALERAIKGAKQ